MVSYPKVQWLYEITFNGESSEAEGITTTLTILSGYF